MSSNDKQTPKQGVVADVSHEDIEELKRDMRSAQFAAWAEANQQKLIAAVVAVIAIIVAVSLWKDHRDSQRASAATLYVQALNTTKQDDRRAMLQEVIKDYDNTVYGGLARLLLASNDPAHAADYLQAAMNRTDLDNGIRTQARLDLAQLKINAGDKAAANQLLSTAVGTDYEQLRQYLLAEAAPDAASRIEHLKNARDAVSHDTELARQIEQKLSAAGVDVSSKQG